MKQALIMDRAYEKLGDLGPRHLDDNELLAIIVGSRRHRLRPLTLANRVLAEAAGIHGLTRVSSEELQRIRGIDTATAAQVLGAIELGRRTLTQRPTRLHLRTPREMAAYLLPRFGNDRVEQFGIIMLDARRGVLKATAVSRGIVDGCLVHPREVFREAILRGATAMVPFHNHPSGDPSPTVDDEKITLRLLMAGDIIGIAVVDHIILGDATYFSFGEAKRLHRLGRLEYGRNSQSKRRPRQTCPRRVD
ncbi:MAG: RadC family protein [Vicinamibacteraceae bacterium]